MSLSDRKLRATLSAMILARSWRPLLPWLIIILGSLIFLAVAEKPWADGLDTSKAVKDSIRTHSWAVIGLWWGAAINVVIASAVAVFLWLKRNHLPAPSPSLPFAPEANSLTKKERVLLPIAIAIIAVLGALTMHSRLNLSLWGDEQATTYRYIIGNVYRVGENQDEFVLKTPHWEKTFFNWEQGPSNQVMFSVLARLVHGPGDVSPENPGQFYFSEWKIRLPSYLAGIGAILSTCWLVWLLGAPRGAPFAGLLMVIHPLIIRYSTEARGYALLLFFGPLVICFLIKALQTTRLKWWTPFGITQFFLLWSYFGSIYLLVPLNCAALWLAWDFSKNKNPLRSSQFLRYTGATLLGAMLTIQLMLPNLLQLPGFLESGRLEGSIDKAWLQDSVSFWFSGMPWHEWEQGNPNSLTTQAIAHGNFFGACFAPISALILLCIASFKMLQTPKWRTFWCILTIPVLIMVGHAKASGNVLYPWYTVGFLPLGIVLLCQSAKLEAFTKQKSLWPRLLPGWLGICLAGFLLMTGSQRSNIRHNSIEPLIESTRLTRKVVNPFHPKIDDVRTIAFHHASRLYDPAALIATSDAEFIDAIKSVEKEGKPLWINTAHIPFGKEFFPKAFELLENTDVFEEPKIFWGMQQPCTRFAFKYKPGGLARAGIN